MTRTAQTRIIVATAAALALTDIGVRLSTLRASAPTVNGGVVTARAFQLVDDSGTPRATLTVDNTGEPGLCMYDRNGSIRLQLDTWQNNPSLLLYDKQGHRRTFIGTNERTGHGVLTEYAADGETRGTSIELNETTGTVYPNQPMGRITFQRVSPYAPLVPPPPPPPPVPVLLR